MFSTLFGTQLVRTAEPVHAAGTNWAPAFPRIATALSKTNMNTDQTQQMIAKHMLYVTDPINWPAKDQNNTSMTIGQYLKSLNPSMIAMIYYHSNLYNEGEWPSVANGTTYHIDPRWLITYAGSSLSSSVSPSATSIPVGDLSRFHVDDRVVIGGVGNQSQPEVVHVTGMSGSSGAGSLTVARAFMEAGAFPAISHNAGDFVRTAAYTFGWPGNMLFNVTSNCPTSNVNPSLGAQTFNQFIASFISTQLKPAAFTNLDGVFLDNFVDNASFVENQWQVDANNNNQASGMTDSLYGPGMADLAAKVQAALPAGWAVMGNTGGWNYAANGKVMSGGMIEGFDEHGNSMQGGAAGDLAFYNAWMTNGHSPKTFIMNGSATGSLSQSQTNYQAMRFGLALTLTNDGYFDYDDRASSQQSHDTVWWYDEYDNAGQGTGYLGMPTGPAIEPITGVYRRNFDKGISLVNTTTSPQTIALGGTFQKIKGTQAPTVNDGSTVSSVTLQPYDGIILLGSAGSTATPTPEPTLTPTPLPTSGDPAGPSNLQGSVQPGQINLNWTASSTANVTYNIYRGWQSGQEGLYESGVSGTSFADTAVQAGVWYFYKVSAVLNGVESSQSNEAAWLQATAAPAATPPPSSVSVSAPSNLTGAAQPGHIDLNWTASSTGSVTYNIYRGWQSGQEGLYKSGVSGTSFSDTNVQPGVWYFYKVSAVLNGTESGLSNEAAWLQGQSATTTTAAPSGLTASVQSGQIDLNWIASSTANATYNIYRGWQAGQESLYKSGVTGTSFADTGVTNGVYYFYKVSAVANGVESPQSNEVGWVLAVVGSTSQSTQVAAPSGLSASAQAGHINLKWTASSTAGATYNVYRGYQGGQESLYKGGISGTTFSDTAVTRNTWYFYKVSAVADGGESQQSNEAKAKGL